MEEKIELTNEQKLLIVTTWNNRKENPPSIAELMRLVFPELLDIDPRTKQGRAIKEYLATQGIKPEAPTYFKPKGLLELTKEQQEYIVNNSNMKSFEMARELFHNPTLVSTSQEARSIYKFIKDNKQIKYDSTIDEDSPEKDYQPPKTLDRVIARINKYVKDANLDFKKISPIQKKQCMALIGYLHDFRFIHQMNTLESQGDRSLFESCFIKYTFDKEDLSQEDIDQYIILSIEAVMSSNIQKTIVNLQNEQDMIMSEEGKMSMALVEAIKTSRDEYNNSVKRQQSLYKALTEERSKRLSERISETQSLLTLVDLWKQDETRRQMIKIAEDRKEKLSEEIDRLTNMDDLKIRLVGISKEEILNG